MRSVSIGYAPALLPLAITTKLRVRSVEEVTRLKQKVFIFLACAQTFP